MFHTFFGLAGLSLMRLEHPGSLHAQLGLLVGSLFFRRVDLAPIHCVYALPLEAKDFVQPFSAFLDRSCCPGCAEDEASPNLAHL